MDYQTKVEMKVKLLHERAVKISFNGYKETDKEILKLESKIKKLDLIYFKEYNVIKELKKWTEPKQES